MTTCSFWSEIKRFLLCLSGANLLFLPIWNDLLGRSWYFDLPYVRFSPFLLLVTVLIVLLSGFFFYFITFVEKRFQSSFLKSLFTILYAVSLTGVLISFLLSYSTKHEIGFFSPIFAQVKMFLSTLNFWTKAVSLIVILGLLLRFIAVHVEMIEKGIKYLQIIFVPFLIFTFVQAFYIFSTIHFYTNKGPVDYLQVKEGQPRLAFLLFDELDIRAAFDERPAFLKLENLDAFKKQSFFATRAIAAGPETGISVPAMLTGLPLFDVKFKTHDQAELILRSTSEKVILNKNSPSLFSKIRDLGFNCGVKGFFHPYYKLFGPSLSYCDVKPIYPNSLSDAFSYIFKKIYNNFKKHFIDVVSDNPQILVMVQKYIGKDRDEDQEIAHQNIIEYWSSILLDKKLHFSFVHFPYPHPPGRYNYEKERFCNQYEGSYLGNLKMVDITIADIRRKLGEASLWDETTIIITSDHWLRKNWPKCGYSFNAEELKFVNSIDHRVPFMIKFANQKDPLVFNEPFNTVLIHNVILEIFEGNIKNAHELSLWIQKNKDKVPVEVDEERPKHG